VKIGTLFSGGGGVDIGAMAAGLAPVWGVEYDPDIAAVYAANVGDHIRIGDILTMAPADFAPVDVLHASPPCPNFSVAKAGGEETETDRALAEKVAEFIACLLPDFFTLENVYQYRLSLSWRRIAQELATHGYQYNYWHVNMADYGVPQTRKRMIVIARRDGLRPQLPAATHAENPQPGLFGTAARWVSWHEAIEDLLPGLPDSQFADWQLARLPADLPRAFIVDGKLSSGLDGKTLQINDGNTPSGTVVCSHSALRDARAFTNGRVVKMTPRALTRFQSFPDSYRLPGRAQLATRIIGNAVPPLFMQRLYEGLRE
jgi:DNA (cytosine-5)-methyltransferase 1